MPFCHIKKLIEKHVSEYFKINFNNTENNILKFEVQNQTFKSIDFTYFKVS